MECSVENVILRRIFHVVSYFPLHFMLYRGNLDYFSDSVGFKPPGPLFPQSYALSICNHISDNKQYIPNLNQKALIHIADFNNHISYKKVSTSPPISYGNCTCSVNFFFMRVWGDGKGLWGEKGRGFLFPFPSNLWDQNLCPLAFRL